MNIRSITETREQIPEALSRRTTPHLSHRPYYSRRGNRQLKNRYIRRFLWIQIRKKSYGDSVLCCELTPFLIVHSEAEYLCWKHHCKALAGRVILIHVHRFDTVLTSFIYVFQVMTLVIALHVDHIPEVHLRGNLSLPSSYE